MQNLRKEIVFKLLESDFEAKNTDELLKVARVIEGYIQYDAIIPPYVATITEVVEDTVLLHKGTRFYYGENMYEVVEDIPVFADEYLLNEAIRKSRYFDIEIASKRIIEGRLSACTRPTLRIGDYHFVAQAALGITKNIAELVI